MIGAAIAAAPTRNNGARKLMTHDAPASPVEYVCAFASGSGRNQREPSPGGDPWRNDDSSSQASGRSLPPGSNATPAVSSTPSGPCADQYRYRGPIPYHGKDSPYRS